MRMMSFVELELYRSAVGTGGASRVSNLDRCTGQKGWVHDSFLHGGDAGIDFVSRKISFITVSAKEPGGTVDIVSLKK
jgi:hypothetical protein